MLILSEARETPAEDRPITRCIIINSDMVRKYFSGIVVKVQARIEMINKGPKMASTDLLTVCKFTPSSEESEFSHRLRMENPIINDMLKPSLFSI